MSAHPRQNLEAKHKRRFFRPFRNEAAFTALCGRWKPEGRGRPGRSGISHKPGTPFWERTVR